MAIVVLFDKQLEDGNGVFVVQMLQEGINDVGFAEFIPESPKESLLFGICNRDVMSHCFSNIVKIMIECIGDCR